MQSSLPQSGAERPPEARLIPDVAQFMSDKGNLLRCLDSVPTPVAILRLVEDEKGNPLDMQVAYCNEPVSALFQRPMEALTGGSVRKEIQPDDDGWLECFERVARTGKPDTFRLPLKRFGNCIEMEISRPCRGYCFVLFNDITDRFVLEEKLRDYQSAVSTMMCNELTAVFFYDIDRDMLYNTLASALSKLMRHPRVFRLRDIPYSLVNMNVVRSVDVQKIEKNLLIPLKENAPEVSLELSLNFSARDRRENWKWYSVAMHRYRTVDPAARRAVVTVRKIQKEVDLRNKLRRKADMDPGTGVYNRQAAIEFINTSLQDKHESCQFFLFDIDRFKNVNDTYGHIVGDHVIQFFAHILMEHMRNHIVFRLGGDEFAAFGQGHSYESIETFCSGVNRALKMQDQFPFPIHCSIGVAWANSNCTYEDLYALADRQLYVAKDAGRHTWRSAIVQKCAGSCGIEPLRRKS